MEEQQGQSPHKECDASKDDQGAAENPSTVSVSLKGNESPIHAENASPYEKTRKYKKPLTRYESKTIIFGIVGILVAAATGGAIVWQDRIASAALSEMQKEYPKLAETADAANSAAVTAVASLRPWIKITDVKTRGEGPLIPALSFQRSPTWPVGQSQATLQLQISLKNVGHSPARLSVDFELFLPLWENGYSGVIYREKRRFCREFAKRELEVDPSLQIILFPDESHDWYGAGATMVNNKVVNYFSDDRGTVPYILPVVAVCTNYQLGDSPTIYQTSALYEVFRKNDRTRFFEVGKGIPASEIFLIRNEASDDAY